MTNDEARYVVTIIMKADGGCHICAAALARLFIKKFPEHNDVARRIYQEIHGLKLG